MWISSWKHHDEIWYVCCCFPSALLSVYKVLFVSSTKKIGQPPYICQVQYKFLSFKFFSNLWCLLFQGEKLGGAVCLSSLKVPWRMRWSRILVTCLSVQSLPLFPGRSPLCGWSASFSTGLTHFCADRFHSDITGCSGERAFLSLMGNAHQLSSHFLLTHSAGSPLASFCPRCTIDYGFCCFSAFSRPALLL